MDNLLAAQQTGVRSIAAPVVFILLALVLSVYMMVSTWRDNSWWVVFYCAYIVSTFTALLLVVRRHPWGRNLTIWLPWIALGSSLPCFHRAFYLVSQYPLADHPGFQETMAFFFAIGYAFVLLPAAVLLTRPTARAAFGIIEHPRERLPWPVWGAAVLYCVPLILSFIHVGIDIASHTSYWSYGYLVDLGALGLLLVAISLVKRKQFARVIALWLPLMLCVFGALLAWVFQHQTVGNDTVVSAFDTALMAGVLIACACVLIPAMLLLNLPAARGAFSSNLHGKTCEQESV